jgi:long-chain fatty acid transport protein
MKKSLITRLIIFAVISVFCIPAGRAFAAGFALYEGSARGNALGGALIARADDPSAIFYNPAGITQLEGTQMMTGCTLITPMNKVTTHSFFGSGTEETELRRNWFYPPYGYLTRQVSDKLWVGVGMFARFGLGTEYPENWPGRYNSYNAVVKGVEINPNVAWKFNDCFSIAAGASVMRLDVKLEQIVPIFNVNSSLKGHSYGFGFNLAAHYKPREWVSFGLLYRSKVKHNLSGRADFEQTGLLRRAFPNGRISADVLLPDEYFLGVAFKPIKKLSIEFDAILTRWNTFNHMTVNFDKGIAGMNGITKQKDWHDVWRYQIGVEYALTPIVDLRLGYTYDNEPIPARGVDFLVSSYDRQLFSCGFGLHLGEHWTADFSYTYLQPKNRNYEERIVDGVPKSRVHDGNCYLIGVGIGYKF